VEADLGAWSERLARAARREELARWAARREEHQVADRLEDQWAAAYQVAAALLGAVDPVEVCRYLYPDQPERQERVARGLRLVAELMDREPLDPDQEAALREYLSGPDRSVRPVAPRHLSEDYPGLAVPSQDPQWRLDLWQERERRDQVPAGQVAWPVERQAADPYLASDRPYPVAGPGAGPQCPVVARPARQARRQVAALPDLAVYRGPARPGP